MYEYDPSELEFTTLDILSDNILIKPFFNILKKTKLVKNYNIY